MVNKNTNKRLSKEHFDNLSKNVDKKYISKLPKKHKINLFNIGKMKDDLVSIGYDEDKKQFNYPVLDFGWLSNYLQVPGKKNKFLPKYFLLKRSTDITKHLD